MLGLPSGAKRSSAVQASSRPFLFLTLDGLRRQDRSVIPRARAVAPEPGGRREGFAVEVAAVRWSPKAALLTAVHMDVQAATGEARREAAGWRQ